MIAPVRPVLLFLVLTASAAAQDAAPGGAGPDPAERWRRLDPEQRRLAEERFERWKRLDEQERRRIEERHAALERLRKEVLQALPPRERRRIEGLPPEQRRRELERLVHRRLEQVRERLRSAHGGRGPRGPGLGRLPQRVRERLLERLLELVDRGELTSDRVDEWLDLPPLELAHRLLGLRKKRWLEHPPEEWRELPDEERRRLAALEPEAFFEELARRTGRQPELLPRPLREILEGGGGRALPERRLRRVLTPEEWRSVASLEGRARGEALARILEEKLRREIERRGEGRRRLERALGLPPGPRVRRLLQLLEHRAGGVPGRGRRRPAEQQKGKRRSF